MNMFIELRLKLTTVLLISSTKMPLVSCCYQHSEFTQVREKENLHAMNSIQHKKLKKTKCKNCYQESSTKLRFPYILLILTILIHIHHSHTHYDPKLLPNQPPNKSQFHVHHNFHPCSFLLHNRRSHKSPETPQHTSH